MKASTFLNVLAVLCLFAQCFAFALFATGYDSQHEKVMLQSSGVACAVLCFAFLVLAEFAREQE